MPHGSQTRKLGWNLFRGASGMGRRHRGTSTPQDLLLPEGKLIRTTRGGPNALKQLLLDLKKYSFSGYVRTVRGGSGKRSEGIVLLRGGDPEARLDHRGGTQDPGRSALKKGGQGSEHGDGHPGVPPPRGKDRVVARKHGTIPRRPPE